MKRWLKRHWRWLGAGFYLLLSVNAGWGIVRAVASGNDLYLVIHVLGICFFPLIFLWLSGIMGRLIAWWEND